MRFIQKLFAANVVVFRNRQYKNYLQAYQLQKQATTAFGIATICLGVQNANLKDENNKIATQPSPTTTTKSSSEATTTTPAPITTTLAPSTTPLPIDMAKYRLPGNVEPTHYDLDLYPNLQTGLFQGVVTAHINVLQPTSEIVMHSHLLNITGVAVDKVAGKFDLDSDFELLTIRSNDGKTFEANSNIQVTVNFEGDLTKSIVGFYKSTYVNNNGETRTIATSKFEPTYARQAYPCFDEPQYKATYKIRLLKPKDDTYIALSNYPEEVGAEDVPEGTLVPFQKTVPMSTYLACFIVCDFSKTEKTFTNKDVQTPLRVFFSPGQDRKANYALDVGVSVMNYYVNYFNIPYPLPKLDMIAIPDFVSGAMEHWGLVTYRETSLLYESTTHSSANQQRVAEVVAHELAHSWFGNLVTMKWWNNLWLNEGFATYIEYKGVNAHHSDWEMMSQFVVDTMHSILALDATAGSHPIVQKVETPDQITEVFDAVSYNKGASVLRMLENSIGENVFAEGVTNYLEAHKYENAENSDLWKELQNIVGTNVLDVYTFMDTFTNQMGYPIVDVTFNGLKCTLKQKRFVLDQSAADNAPSSEFQYKWTIPISYITNNGKSKIYWFNHTQNELVLDLDEYKWIKFNPDQVGYYRVNYNESVWQDLITNVLEMSVTDRTHLLEESFSIAQAGQLSYKIPLDLTSYLMNETEYLPWTVASSKFQSLSTYLINSPAQQVLQDHVVKLLTPAYNQLGWEENDSEKHLEKRARVTILSLACAFNFNDALQVARERFDKWIENDTMTIEPNLRPIVYKYGMLDASNEKWSLVFERFNKESDASEKLKLMNGLANVRNPTLLHKLIDLAKTEDYIRGQDYFTLLQYISANPVGTSIVWDYVREHWDELVARFTLNDRYLGRLIPAITSTFSSKIKLQEMEQFFKDNPDAGAGASARLQALETVNNNILWLEKYKTEVENWINGQKR